MTQTIEFEGTRHEFPDDATQEEIGRILGGGAAPRHKDPVVTGMPAFDPTKPYEVVGAPPFDPTKPFETVSTKERPGALDYVRGAVDPITNIPSTAKRFAQEGIEEVGTGIEQIKSGKPWEVAKGVGNVALGGVGYTTAWPSALVHEIVGKPVEAHTGIPAVWPETAASLVMPIPKGLPRVAPRAAAAPTRVLDVTLSEGQATGDLSKIQREQAALRNRSGPPAQRVAQEFTEQQRGELAAARERIARGFDPFEQRIAETPQEGEVVSRSMQSAAGSAKAGVDTAYETARNYPGEIHANAFEGIGQRIKGDLSLRDEPIIIDDKLTPYSDEARAVALREIAAVMAP
jgi:hypothetical protein